MIRFWDMNGKEIFDIENRTADWVKLSLDGNYLAIKNVSVEGWPVELWPFDQRLLVKKTKQIRIPGNEYQ